MIAYDPEIAEAFGQGICCRGGAHYSGASIDCKTHGVKECGLLPKAAEHPKENDDDIGFEDIDNVAG